MNRPKGLIFFTIFYSSHTRKKQIFSPRYVSTRPHQDCWFRPPYLNSAASETTFSRSFTCPCNSPPYVTTNILKWMIKVDFLESPYSSKTQPRQFSRQEGVWVEIKNRTELKGIYSSAIAIPQINLHRSYFPCSKNIDYVNQSIPKVSQI